jgi:hypothetical protein
MSMGNPSNLGGAVFTATANTAPLTAGMKAAQAQVQASCTAMQNGIARATQNGSRGLLQGVGPTVVSPGAISTLKRP